MATTRRTPQEILADVAKIKELVAAGGITTSDAIKKVGLSNSVYWKHAKGTFVSKPGKHGKIDVSQLPPRPKKGGKRTPKVLDLNDVSAVALRIAKLDKRLREIDGLVKERIELVAVLLKLLKQRK